MILLKMMNLLRMAAMLFAFAMLLEALSEKRKTSIRVLLFSCLLFPVSILLADSFFSRHPLISSAIQFIAVFAITLNYTMIPIKKLVAISSLVLFMNLIGYVITLIFSISPGLISNDVLGAFVKLIVTLVFSLSTILLKWWIRKNELIADLPEIWVPALVILVSMIGFGVLANIEIPNVQEITNIFFFSGALFLCFYLSNALSTKIKNKLESALQSQQKEYYFTQCQLMEESVDNIRSIRHDMKLHLSTAIDLMENNKTVDACHYLNSLMGEIEKKEVYSNTKNIAFDSIINFKLNNCNKENVKLDIRISIPPVLNIESSDIVTILGNLLDNALDAVASVEEKAIKIDIEYSRESLFIQVDNTFDGIVIYKEGVGKDKHSFVTRKNSGDHGHVAIPQSCIQE